MVGTVGMGSWISHADGERWGRCRGMWNETQVCVSADTGDSWSKGQRELSEIRALAWVPNEPMDQTNWCIQTL
jgi:hypothetical protein